LATPKQGEVKGRFFIGSGFLAGARNDRPDAEANCTVILNGAKRSEESNRMMSGKVFIRLTENLVQGCGVTSPCRFCDVPLLHKERDVLATPKQGEVKGRFFIGSGFLAGARNDRPDAEANCTVILNGAKRSEESKLTVLKISCKAVV
jgi:hypothetical protein